MSRQLTLFGAVAKQKSKKYIIYKNPTGPYESFIERHCLRDTNPHKKKELLTMEAQADWSKLSKDSAGLEEYLKLRNGEKPFVRYIYILLFYLFVFFAIISIDF